MSVEGKFLSKEINDLFWREGLTLVTAESCTAGSVAGGFLGREVGRPLLQPLPEVHTSLKVELLPIPTK